MVDPSYKDERRLKKYIDRLYNMADSDEGIPKVCPCGGRIIVETSETEIMARRFFTCNVFENDGLHRRKCWVDGVEEELSQLKKEVEQLKRKFGSFENLIAEMRTELNKNAEDIANLKQN